MYPGLWSRALWCKGERGDPSPGLLLGLGGRDPWSLALWPWLSVVVRCSRSLGSFRQRSSRETGPTLTGPALWREARLGSTPAQEPVRLTPLWEFSESMGSSSAEALGPVPHSGATALGRPDLLTAPSPGPLGLGSVCTGGFKQLPRCRNALKWSKAEQLRLHCVHTPVGWPGRNPGRDWQAGGPAGQMCPNPTGKPFFSHSGGYMGPEPLRGRQRALGDECSRGAVSQTKLPAPCLLKPFLHLVSSESLMSAQTRRPGVLCS